MEKKRLQKLLENAKSLGLDQHSIDIANEYLEYKEYELCFDIIAEHLYENNILINKLVFEQMMSFVECMKLSPNNYSFLEELYKTKE